jgi:hypothetical protein
MPAYRGPGPKQIDRFKGLPRATTLDYPYYLTEGLDGLLILEHEVVNATASGNTVSVSVSLIPGTASGSSGGTNGNASGATVTTTASLVSGSASGSATASGQTVSVTVSLIPGTATGSATASGQTISVGASLIPGTASGNGNASGQTISVTASLIAGSATGSATATGATLTIGASLIPGMATGSGLAQGQILSATASLIAGSASYTPSDQRGNGIAAEVRLFRTATGEIVLTATSREIPLAPHQAGERPTSITETAERSYVTSAGEE